MPLRISGGEFKGRRIDSPTSGKGIRPTTEKVKLAIFSIIGMPFVQNSKVLDLYACTGALGIEALSRGAVRAVFVEKLRRNCALIEKNLSTLNIADRGVVTKSTVKRFLDLSNERFDIVLLDPPFEHDEWEEVMGCLGSGVNVTQGGIVIGEHKSQVRLKNQYGNLEMESTRQYGGSQLSIFKAVT